MKVDLRSPNMLGSWKKSRNKELGTRENSCCSGDETRFYPPAEWGALLSPENLTSAAVGLFSLVIRKTQNFLWFPLHSFIPLLCSLQGSSSLGSLNPLSQAGRHSIYNWTKGKPQIRKLPCYNIRNNKTIPLQCSWRASGALTYPKLQLEWGLTWVFHILTVCV